MLGRQTAGIDDFDNQLNDPGQYDNPQDPASLSVVEHLRSLSVNGKLTLLYLLAVIVFLLCWLRGDWVSAGCLDARCCAMCVVPEFSGVSGYFCCLASVELAHPKKSTSQQKSWC